MFKLLRPCKSEAAEEAPPPAERQERRRVKRAPAFKDAVVWIADYYRIQVAIRDWSARGVRIEYVARVDLPSRVLICAPPLVERRWARVVWQCDGAAGLALQDLV